MIDSLVSGGTEDALPIHAVPESEFEDWAAAQPVALRAWLKDTGFEAKAGATTLVPDNEGLLAAAVFVRPDAADLWDWAGLADKLAPGVYAIEGPLETADAEAAALAWMLGAYRFERYRPNGKERAKLVWPENTRRDRVERAARFTGLARDLINTPANDLGPPELAERARELGGEFGARVDVVDGAALVEGFPAVHAVGRAHVRPPCLIDLRWGDETAPKVTLVGKGVTFDSGGLDLKTASGMELMKKDMGGGAHALALGGMVMDAALPVRLRVLVPAVENSVSGDAMRPGDVIRTRKGLSIEIGNTDAEGRVILADALALASEDDPELILDFATLTGAARIALGTEVPALFCNDDTMAGGLMAAAEAVSDPLWRMPLWKGYEREIEGKIADLNNAPKNRYGGAITAALFLQRFVEAGIPWGHIDVMAWMTASRPGRPEGGEAMGLRAAFEYLQTRFG